MREIIAIVFLTFLLLVLNIKVYHFFWFHIHLILYSPLMSAYFVLSNFIYLEMLCYCFNLAFLEFRKLNSLILIILHIIKPFLTIISSYVFQAPVFIHLTLTKLSPAFLLSLENHSFSDNILCIFLNSNNYYYYN